MDSLASFRHADGPAATGSSTHDHLRRWNDLQNTPRDIQLLTDHLINEYRHASRSKAKGSRRRG